MDERPRRAKLCAMSEGMSTSSSTARASAVLSRENEGPNSASPRDFCAAPAPWPLGRWGASSLKFGSEEIHQGSEAQQRTDGPDERSLAARVPAAAQQLQSRLAGSGSEPGREAAVYYRSGLAASLCGRGGQLTTRDQKVDTVGTVRRSQSARRVRQQYMRHVVVECMP